LTERPRVGLVSCYFTLFDEQMPAGFRAEREEVVRGYAGLLRREFDVLEAGMLTSEAEGEQAGVTLREAAPDAVVFAPSMAAPPSYAAAALAGLDAPIVIWNGPTIGRLPAGLTQAQATVNSSQVAAVMLANALVRDRRPFTTVTAAPGDPAGEELLFRTVRAAAAASSLRGASVLRVGAAFPGYLDVEAGSTDLDRLGVTERAVTAAALNEAFAGVDSERIDRGLAALGGRGWTRREGEADERSMRLALALEDLARGENAVAATINCHSDLLRWNPEVGITGCLGASLLTAAGIPVSCTGDLPTALALRLARALSGRALYCEFYTPERETGLMLLAAGGEGDPAWADPAAPVVVEPNVHYPGEHGAGTSLSFRLEPGPATALSLSPVGDTWRLAWATGEIVEARYDSMGGPNGMFRFDSGSAFEAGARWIESGAGHHNALAGGRLDVEIPVLANAMGIEEVRV
jgi:L-arabinose isomerase C-terminal domain